MIIVSPSFRYMCRYDVLFELLGEKEDEILALRREMDDLKALFRDQINQLLPG